MALLNVQICCELDAKKFVASFDRSALKYKLMPAEREIQNNLR